MIIKQVIDIENPIEELTLIEIYDLIDEVVDENKECDSYGYPLNTPLDFN